LTHPIKFSPSFRQQIQLTIDKAKILGKLTLGIGPVSQNARLKYLGYCCFLQPNLTAIRVTELLEFTSPMAT
jgi:hypothetical protein